MIYLSQLLGAAVEDLQGARVGKIVDVLVDGFSPAIVRDSSHHRRGHGRKIVAIHGGIGTVAESGVLGVRLIKFDTVAIDLAILKVNAVASNPDDTLYENEARLFGRHENDDIFALGIAISNERFEPTRRR